MKAQCFLCKKIRLQKDIELKEVHQKGLLVYVCLNHNEENENYEKTNQK